MSTTATQGTTAVQLGNDLTNDANRLVKCSSYSQKFVVTLMSTSGKLASTGALVFSASVNLNGSSEGSPW
ncbi:hemagluttinin repeat protein [Anopheles sinensis]|uniref:Hemagluttinin repeat protein n=1 Tax=Anopheles sinensis TaxID=74873 RepID=A0A084VXR3_ANOSI|nr:hemagluttinin repeat protein [Anopheles sinensis]